MEFSLLPKVLGLPTSWDEGVIGLYILGSRLWGTSKAKSDYDLLLVLKTFPSKTYSTSLILSYNPVDVLVISLEEFLSRLNQARLPEILCLSAPRDCIIKPVPGLHLIKISIQSLKESVSIETSKDWERARKLISRKDLSEGKKVIIHCLRFLEFSKCLISNNMDFGRIDIHSFNEVLYELQNCFEKEWTYYETTYGVTKDTLLTEILSAKNE